MPGTYRFVLEKRHLKFSAAHFTIFGPAHAEELHGHNFRVKVACTGTLLDDCDLLLDISKPEATLQKLCASLNQRTLLPGHSSLVGIKRSDGMVEGQFGTKTWRFPDEGVVVLPVKNISCEALAAFVWKELRPTMLGTRIETMAVAIEEGDGLCFWYENEIGTDA